MSFRSLLNSKALARRAQDESGRPLPGFSLANSTEIYGDEIVRTVGWSKGTSVKSLEGQSVRLRFVMKDADLYSMRFE